VERPASQSRLTNFPLGIGTLIRYILLIPHIVVLYFVTLIAYILYFLATFGILFTGKYPRGMFNFVVGFMRWSANVGAYLNSLIDKYPPFSTEAQEYPVSLEVDYPETSSRLLNFPILGITIKELLLIPHLIVLIFLFVAVFVVVFIAKFAILFSGSFPEGMHRFVVGVTRWQMRISAYMLGLTDKYPPFSMN
jgi:hypothetical protein